MEMNSRKVAAIFPSLDPDNVENALIGIGVHHDRLCPRGDIHAVDQADEVVRAIARTVHNGLDSDGVIAVLPVEDLVHIRDFKES